MPNYYVTIGGKKYDRGLYEEALKAVNREGDGRISRADAEKLLEKVLDAAPGQKDVYSAVEKETVKFLRDTMKWTDAGDRHFRDTIHHVAALKGWQTRLPTTPGTTPTPTPTPAPTPTPTPSGPATGATLSTLFPSDSRYGNRIMDAPIPAGTNPSDVEESAHVLNYTLASGNYCELWWKGGDAGVPLIAYLVDANGPHYLPELSQPSADGAPAFANLDEAKSRFVALAENLYAVPVDIPAGTISATDIVRRVVAEYGLDQMRLLIPEAEAQAQLRELGGSVDFEQALRQSLDSFLKDGSSGESPLEVLRNSLPLPGVPDDLDAALKHFCNRPSTTLALIPRTVTDLERDAGYLPPEWGEPVAQNWVFSLYLNDLSDHLHWAITARDGSRATYNYGFN